MIKLIVRLILNSLAILVTAYLTPGVYINKFLTAMAVTVVLGLLNTFVKPLLIVLTLPINILTLGLFTLIVNALVVLMASYLVPNFQVDGILPAIVFSLVLTLVNWVFSSAV